LVQRNPEAWAQDGVHVGGVVLAAVVLGGAAGGVLRPDLERVLVYVVAVGMV